MTEHLNKLCLYALNYDLLLQYPVHRQHGSLKIQRPLQQDVDAALVAEETLTVEALDLIEFLYKAEKSKNTNTQPQETRLKRLLPLLLYRYRPCEEINTQTEEEKETAPMVITKDRQLMQVLSFNFRPFNTGLRYDDWPLGRTQELVITSENHKEPGLEHELLTGDQNVYYVAEPVDKLQWLSSKRSSNGAEPFNVIKFYENVDAFFLKYAPRAKMIRKARFRSIMPETRQFRQFLFETQFYKNNQSNQVAQMWDCTWRNCFQDTALPAHLLVLLQPTTVEAFATQCTALSLVFSFATNGWTPEQKLSLQHLCKATPYEKTIDSETSINVSLVLSAVIECVGIGQMCNNKIRAAAAALYIGLQSRFTAYKGDVKACVNSVYRAVLSLEQSIDVEKTTFDSFLTNWQLWYLAKQMIMYLQTFDLRLESLDFVSNFTQYITENVKLFSEEAFSHDLQTVTATLQKK